MIRRLAATLLLASASASFRDALIAERERFAIAGYAPDYRLDALDLNKVGANATDIILFSIMPTAESTIDPGGVTTMHHMRAARAKKTNPRLRVLISVGGAGRSKYWPKSVETAAGRAKLAKVLLKYCKRGKLDGVDIDWEAPLDAFKVHHLVEFLKLLREKFDELDPPLMLTMAMHPQHAEELDATYEHVDRIHLMSYDLPYKEGHTAVSAASQAVQGTLRAGCPREKLAMGVAFYGRRLDDPGVAAPFAELHRAQQAALAVAEGSQFRDDRVDGYAFDSPSTVQLKVELAAALGLAGVMVWELGQDVVTPERKGGVLLAELAAAAAVSSEAWSPGHKQDTRRVSAAHNAVSMFYRTAAEHDEL